MTCRDFTGILELVPEQYYWRTSMRKLFLALIFTLWSGIAAAGIYWLPDYLKNNIDTNHRTDTAPDNSGDIKPECKSYQPKCNPPKVPGGEKIRIAGDLFCPMECVCPSEYKYNSLNCSGDKELSGSVCEGKYNGCRSLSCEERGLKTCGSACIAASACCTDSDCGNGNKACTNNRCEGCKTGYKLCGSKCISTSTCCTDGQEGCDNGYNCSDQGECVRKTCADFNSNYKESRVSGYYCPQVSASTVGNLTCYSCSQTCQSQYSDYNENGTCKPGQTPVYGTNGCESWVKCDGESCPQEIVCDYGCGKKNTRTDCKINGQTDYCIDCKPCTACTDDYALTRCPDNASCDRCQDTCNNTTKYKFKGCNSGYIKTEGSNSCRKPTCEEMGQKTCNGKCIAKSECCGCTSSQKCVSGSCVAKTCADAGGPVCPAGQKCQNGTCVAKARACQVGDIYYSDRTCSDTYITSKDPLGVIVDPTRRLLIDLVERRVPFHTSSANIAGGSEEIPGYPAERGYENTKAINKESRYISACWKSSPSMEGGKWYVPSTGELNWIQQEPSILQAVNNGLQKLGSSAVPLANKIWTSDVFRNNSPNMIVWNPAASRVVTPAPAKTADDVYFRCVARYKCPEGENCNEIVPKKVSDKIGAEPSSIYVKGQISCPAGYQKETFFWNTAYTRCYVSTGGGSSDPSKPACQEGDRLYCNNGSCFCTLDSDSNYFTVSNVSYDRVGTVGKDGLVIATTGYSVSSSSQIASLEAACGKMTRESPFTSGWKLSSTSDTQQLTWRSILKGSYTAAKSGSYLQFWDGGYWGSYDEYHRYDSIACSRSFSNIYREHCNWCNPPIP